MTAIVVSLAVTALAGSLPAVAAWWTAKYEPPLAELLDRGRLMDDLLRRHAS